jgi:Zn-dependent oligopeptidase
MDAFEQQQMSALGMPAAMVPRHRPGSSAAIFYFVLKTPQLDCVFPLSAAHFAHLFSSSQYAAQYYVYLWAEILDADAYEAFEETGDIFDAATAALARKCIYAAGNTVEPGATFAAFRGRAPVIEPMLRKKGLL